MLLLRNIPSMDVSQSTQVLEDICIVSKFWLLQIKGLQAFSAEFLWDHKFKFIWDNAQEENCWVTWKIHS